MLCLCFIRRVHCAFSVEKLSPNVPHGDVLHRPRQFQIFQLKFSTQVTIVKHGLRASGGRGRARAWSYSPAESSCSGEEETTQQTPGVIAEPAAEFMLLLLPEMSRMMGNDSNDSRQSFHPKKKSKTTTNVTVAQE